MVHGQSVGNACEEMFDLNPHQDASGAQPRVLSQRLRQRLAQLKSTVSISRAMTVLQSDLKPMMVIERFPAECATATLRISKCRRDWEMAAEKRKAMILQQRSSATSVTRSFGSASRNRPPLGYLKRKQTASSSQSAMGHPRKGSCPRVPLSFLPGKTYSRLHTEFKWKREEPLTCTGGTLNKNENFRINVWQRGWQRETR